MGGLVAFVLNPAWMSWASLPLPTAVRWAGVAVGLPTVALGMWTFHSLGRNITDTVVTRRGHTLVTSGPYRYIRHPFYVTSALALAANALTAANWFIALTGFAALVLLVLRTATEEAKLVERFRRRLQGLHGADGPLLPAPPVRAADGGVGHRRSPSAGAPSTRAEAGHSTSSGTAGHRANRSTGIRDAAHSALHSFTMERSRRDPASSRGMLLLRFWPRRGGWSNMPYGKENGGSCRRGNQAQPGGDEERQMKRATVIVLGLMLVWTVGNPGERTLAAQAGGGWTTLFDGSSLDGWNVLGDANWELADGAVQADSGSGFLVTPDSYADFELTLEFWVDEPANSGIFIRCADSQSVADTNSYEVNIYDTRPDQTYRTGGIVRFAAPMSVINTAGRWNTYEIRAEGPRLTVRLNGTLTVDTEDSTYASGPIALQYGAGVVKFRNVRIRVL